MRDIRNAAIFVVATFFGSALPHIGFLFAGFLLPGLILFFWPVTGINPHGGTLGEMMAVGVVGFSLNVIFYSLVFAGIRKLRSRIQR